MFLSLEHKAGKESVAKRSVLLMVKSRLVHR